jgi:hypothetical protein
VFFIILFLGTSEEKEERSVSKNFSAFQTNKFLATIIKMSAEYAD